MTKRVMQGQNEKSKVEKRQPFIVVMGWITLLADIITVFQFVVSGNVISFWTTQWAISIVFTIGLLWAGVGLLKLGGMSEGGADLIMLLFGAGYLIAYIVIFAFLCITQTTKGLLFGDFMGFVLLLCACEIMVFTLNFDKGDLGYLSWFSYAFGIIGLALTFFLIYKYAFVGIELEWAKFIGELFLISIGASGLLSLYTGKVDKPISPLGWIIVLVFSTVIK